MSSGLQHKMYDLEVTPPVGVWEKIAAELDESELTKQFPSRLYNIEIAPPAQVWQSIANTLDEEAVVNDYANKLGSIAVAPPIKVWQSIAATLDEADLVNDYAGKLSSIAVTPPAATWNKIKTSLNAEHEAAIPEHRRLSPLLKYAAAAAIIGFLAWGGIKLFDNKSGDNVVAKQKTTPPDNNNETATINNTVDENIAVSDITASMEEARNDAALEASKKTYAKLDVATTRSKIKKAANFFFVADNYEPTGTRSIIMEPEETPSIDISNRYVMLMTPDGNIIRMSKKLKELVCCVSGEEQDKECVDQMKKWREKIASPSTIHSSSNFMDILNIVNSMQDN